MTIDSCRRRSVCGRNCRCRRLLRSTNRARIIIAPYSMDRRMIPDIPTCNVSDRICDMNAAHSGNADVQTGQVNEQVQTGAAEIVTCNARLGCTDQHPILQHIGDASFLSDCHRFGLGSIRSFDQSANAANPAVRNSRNDDSVTNSEHNGLTRHRITNVRGGVCNFDETCATSTASELPRTLPDQPICMMASTLGQGHMTPNVISGGLLDCVPPPNVYLSDPRGHHRRRRRRHRRSTPHGRRHRHHHHRSLRTFESNEDNERAKPCCSVLGCKLCLSVCLQFKKVLVSFATFGVICVMIGIILGILRAPGNSFFTLSLMFVGLGLILLTMVLIGWKCTPSDHEPCHMLFGLGMYSRVGRRDRHRRERLYWLGELLYPEFRHRRPPPSYADAMHDCREVGDLSERPLPCSPPPSYKSHTSAGRPGIHVIFPRSDESPSSNPPTYRESNTVSRPSIVILNELFSSDIQSTNRQSVSSTQVLIESDYNDDSTETNSGVVNSSFDSSENINDQNDHSAMPIYEDISAAEGNADVTMRTIGPMQTQEQSIDSSVVSPDTSYV